MDHDSSSSFPHASAPGGVFLRNQALFTCVCLEKYLRNLGLENILLFVSVVITAVKCWSSARGFTDVSFPVEVLGEGRGGGWGWRGLQNLTRLWCWTDTVHLGPSMACFQQRNTCFPDDPLCASLYGKLMIFFFKQGKIIIGKPDEATYYSVIKTQSSFLCFKNGMSKMCLFCLPNYMITTLPDVVLLHWMRCYFLLVPSAMWGFFLLFSRKELNLWLLCMQIYRQKPASA